MRESINTAFLIGIIITIYFICMTIYVTSFAYSKTYKIKNRVIEIIEKHDGFEGGEHDVKLKEDIDQFLKDAGYLALKAGSDCPTEEGIENIGTLEGTYRYCVYEYLTVKGPYYKVKVYMSIDLPLISDFIRLQFPLTGETKIIYRY